MNSDRPSPSSPKDVQGPPAWCRALIRLLIRSDRREEIEGDFIESWQSRASRPGGRLWLPLIHDLMSLLWRRRTSPRRPDATRSSRRWAELAEDLRAGAGIVFRERRLTVLIAATLALGVGASGAIISIADYTLFRPLAVPDADAIVAVHGRHKISGQYTATPYPDYEQLRSTTRSFEELAAYFRYGLRLTIDGVSEDIGGEAVTDNFFAMLRLRPVIGRLLQSGDGNEAAPVPVVIAERLWRGRFGSAPSTIGRVLPAGAGRVIVVGVVPDSFDGQNIGWGQTPSVWFPIRAAYSLAPRLKDVDILRRRDIPLTLMVGRLRPGAALRGARAELGVQGVALASDASEGLRDVSFEVNAAGRAKFWPGSRSSVEQSLGAFLAAGFAVLVLVGSNVSGLLLGRASRRYRETALRMALGAGPGRLLRQSAAEGLWLAVPAFLASLGVAFVVQRVLLAFPAVFGAGLRLDFSPDRTLVGSCLALSVLTAVLGMAPVAWQLRHLDLARAWKRESTSVTAAHQSAGRSILLALQVVLSTVLLVGAALVGRSLLDARSMNLGYDLTQLVVIELGPTSNAPIDPARLAGAVDHLRTWPGAEDLALASDPPLSGARSVVDTSRTSGSVEVSANHYEVDSSFFSTIRQPLVAGSLFAEAGSSGRDEAIVNQLLAGRLWPDISPVGESLTIHSDSGPPRTLRVVGVVADTKYETPWEAGQAHVYEPLADTAARLPVILVRAAAPDALVAATRDLWDVPGTAPSAVSTGEERLAVALAPERAAGLFIGAFAALAILIVCIGLYGSATFLVSERRREIAVRVAVGGSPGRVAAQVMRRFAWIVGIGVAIGLSVAALFTPHLSGQAHGVSARDPLAFGAAVAVTLLCCLAASATPAKRACHASPLSLLRGD